MRQFTNETMCQFANLLINLKLKIPNSKLNWSAKIQHLGGGCQGFLSFKLPKKLGIITLYLMTFSLFINHDIVITFDRKRNP